jgi:ABC-type multidrug transport system fused ATPase/permease subunit
LFRDLNFRILAGEKVAIVGESGSGKTTIADILLKIYKISDGDVLIDGISISFLSKF